jgi:hypothetical protein
MKDESVGLCPSAEPGWGGAVAFGIIGGTPSKPLVRYLQKTVVVAEELLALAKPVTPPEVFRFAAPCMNAGCVHFKANSCSLVSRVVENLPEVSDTAPRCGIRRSCQWWRQEGVAACRRCPQVVTENYNPSEQMRVASKPPILDAQAVA